MESLFSALVCCDVVIMNRRVVKWIWQRRQTNLEMSIYCTERHTRETSNLFMKYNISDG